MIVEDIFNFFPFVSTTKVPLTNMAYVIKISLSKITKPT